MRLAKKSSFQFIARIAVVCACSLLTISRIGYSQEVAGVRTELVTESPCWVGQRVSVRIKLLSSTLFSGTPHFDLPEVPGVIILKAKGSPVVSSETIDGESWSAQTHSFSVYPHRAGKIEIPPFPVRFSVTPAIGKPSEEQKLTTQPILFEAKTPPGAEGFSLLISTRELKAEQSWNFQTIDDKPVELSVGDAIKRSLKLEALDIPGMALPSIMFPEIEGLAKYDAPPELNDRESRGDLTGNRTDSATYICEKPGSYNMPSIVVPWWDVESEQLNKIVLEGVTVNVIATEPEQAENTVSGLDLNSSSNDETPWWHHPVLWLALAVAVIVGICWYRRETIGKLFDHRKQQISENELVRFAALETASARNDPVAALNALMKWLETRSAASETATIGQFVSQHENPDLVKQLDALQLAAIGKAESWNGQPLVRALRKAVLSEKKVELSRINSKLPALNPSSKTRV